MPYDLEKFRQDHPVYHNSSLREIATDIFTYNPSSLKQTGIASVEDWESKYDLSETWNRDEQGILKQKRKAEIDRIRKSNMENMNFIERSVKRGGRQTWGMLHGAVGMMGSLTGTEPLKEWGIRGFQHNIEEAMKYPGTEFDEIGEAPGLMKPVVAGKWALEKLGENLPVIATAIATGGLGGVAAGGGRVVGSKVTQKALSNMLKGQVRKAAARQMGLSTAKGLSLKKVSKETLDIAQKKAMQKLGSSVGLEVGMTALEGGGMYGEGIERGYDNPVSALMLGLAAGTVELAGGILPKALNKMFGQQKAGVVSKLLKKANTALRGGKMPEKEMGRLSRMFLSAADNAPQEFAQETTQELLALFNVAVNDPTFEVFSSENIKQMFEAGAAGAAVGTLLGGGGGLVMSRKKAEEIYKEKPTDVEAARQLLKAYHREEWMMKKEAPAEDLGKQPKKEKPEKEPETPLEPTKMPDADLVSERNEIKAGAESEMARKVINPESKAAKDLGVNYTQFLGEDKERFEILEGEIKKRSEAKKKPPEKPTRDYSSTQVDLPKEAAGKVIDLGKKIPESKLYKDDEVSGREDKPHITVRYGMETTDPKEIAPAFEGMGPITAKIGEVSIFETDKYDVIKADIESPELVEANKKVGETVDLPGETFKDYKPHVTIAYVKKGEGKKYVGDRSLEGQEITFDEITLSGKDGKLHKIPLKGEADIASQLKAKEPIALDKIVESGIKINQGEIAEASKHITVSYEDRVDGEIVIPLSEAAAKNGEKMGQYEALIKCIEGA